MNELTFIQKSKDIKFNVLEEIERKYRNETSSQKMVKNSLIRRIASEGISQFQKQFEETFLESDCINNGVSNFLYELEQSSGESFFYDPRRMAIFKDFFKK